MGCPVQVARLRSFFDQVFGSVWLPGHAVPVLQGLGVGDGVTVWFFIGRWTGQVSGKRRESLV